MYLALILMVTVAWFVLLVSGVPLSSGAFQPDKQGRDLAKASVTQLSTSKPVVEATPEEAVSLLSKMDQKQTLSPEPQSLERRRVSRSGSQMGEYPPIHGRLQR
ncbi:hypothetical protein FRC20_000239 [Serendipita sp. 405]|nr:hypothetical protein FRC15_001479 [Serendipita sp. 397]KAG8857575.1 hypothetical protein FRC20_000239 [Serendipita sp. 405]